jgi:hypothetical protein
LVAVLAGAFGVVGRRSRPAACHTQLFGAAVAAALLAGLKFIGSCFAYDPAVHAPTRAARRHAPVPALLEASDRRVIVVSEFDCDVACRRWQVASDGDGECS